MTLPSEIARRIEQGRGSTPADLVLKNGRILDLVTGELIASDVAICGDRIVGTLDTYSGTREIDIRGQVVVPGFIDTHCHVESSLVGPLEFDRCVLPHGVTTALCDPHEIANVLGAAGIGYFLDGADRTVMDLRVNLPSCVPATTLETSGAQLDAKDLLAFADHPKVLGLAEFMNFPGVLAGGPDCLAKLAAFAGGRIDGHAPLLGGRDLNGYLAAGIRTDHEATGAAEAMEKLRKGMTVLIREGSVSKDLHALHGLVTEALSPFIAFCTDDRNPLDIAAEGHIDGMIREVIRLGAPPLAAYRAASHSAARAFGLVDRGLVAPGYRADLAVLGDLEACAVERVLSAGRPVEEALFAGRPTLPPVGRGSMRARRVTAADFAARGQGPSTVVIGVDAGRIITRKLPMSLPYAAGERRVDLANGVAKVAVVERHGRNGNVGVAFVHGFGLRRGAIASSVGHDSHNVCVVGADDADMALAVNRLGELDGGFAVVADGALLAEFALPMAGLMSALPFEDVHDGLHPLRQAARSLGVVLPEPFLQVAFLPLPVIPHLKITDRGLVDVDRMSLVRD